MEGSEMENAGSCYGTLGVSREHIVDIIRDMNIDGPISQDYIDRIAESIADDVAEDLCETADPEEWGSDDVRLAVGRVLCARLGIGA